MAGRRRFKENQVEISLFPFLAVLICTMGMLVMLLVLMSDSSGEKQMAKIQNENDQTTLEKEDRNSDAEKKIALSLKESPDKIASDLKNPVADNEKKKNHNVDNSKEKDHQIHDEEPKDFQKYRDQFKNFSLDQLREETESSDWFLQQLRTLKKKTETALTQERDRLASAEKAVSDRIREIEELKTAIRLLHEKTPENSTPESLKKKISEKEAEVDRLSKEIVQLQEDQKKAKPVYSIIPYQGKSGTRRYPIYVECCKNGVFLMPEGIPFLPEDFLLGKYPGNPFDSGLRTARQCLLNKRTSDGLEKEPYPLLIVRPGGEQAYYAAVYALSSWGGEFGYELVDEDWELAYPPADPQSEFQIRQQVQLARTQMAVPLAALLARVKQKGNLNELKPEFDQGTDSTSSSESWSSESAELAAIQNQLGNGVRFAPARGSGNDSHGNEDSRGSGAAGNIPIGSDVALGNNGISGNGLIQGINSGSAANGLSANGAPANGAPANGALANGFSANGAPAGALVESLSGTLSGSGASGSSGNIIASDNPLVWGNVSGVGGHFNEATTLPAYSGAFSEKMNSGTNSQGTGLSGGYLNGADAVSLAGTSAGTQMAKSDSTGNKTTDNRSLSIGTEGYSTTDNMMIAGTPYSGTAPAQGGKAGSGTAGSVSGTATAGNPVNSSNELLSRIQETGASPSVSESNSSQQFTGNGWEQVGNTTYAQSGSGTSASGSSTSSLSGEGAGIPGPQMNIDKGKKKEEEDKNPGYASSQSAIPGKAINLNEEIRKPVNASVERPVVIECRADSIVFPRQPGLRKSQIIPTQNTAPGNASNVNKELMSAVVLCIKSWGAAGRNMYWVPWIKVKIAAGGEQNYENVKRVFSAQGITVKSEKTE